MDIRQFPRMRYKESKKESRKKNLRPNMSKKIPKKNAGYIMFKEITAWNFPEFIKDRSIQI